LKWYSYSGRIVDDFVIYCNTVRLHSTIGYVTPKNKLDGNEKRIFAQRDQKLAQARKKGEITVVK